MNGSPIMKKNVAFVESAGRWFGLNHMKSDDLISKAALQAVFEGECVGECGCCKHIRHNPEGCSLIDNAPAVDAEPVVRCRACEHWTPLRNFVEIGNCAKTGCTCTPGSFFCADGKRKIDKEKAGD